MARLPAPEQALTDGVVVLRDWREPDVAQLVEACRDAEIPRWTAVPDLYTDEDARAWVRGDPLPREPPGDRVSFAIADAENDDLLLGSISVMRVERGRFGEIGYWLAPWARGRGAMAAAVRLLARWAFQEFALRRIELVIAVDNEASNRVAARAGFTREGVLRDYRENKGVWRDHVMWSLLRGELA
ncbi:MAG: GNAT family N-acetyltransferase [Thermoleophilaceae bacterium]|jgi:RimJ/RimL family protein N-acetyltransferase